MKPIITRKFLKPALQALPMAALMLGAADAGSTVGLNFQSWYYDSKTTPQTIGFGAGYQTTGFPVTAKAFGVAVENWTNTDPLDCSTPTAITGLPVAGLSVDINATNLWESNLTGPGVYVYPAGWPSGDLVKAAMTPGNYEVAWSFLDNTGWSMGLSGLNAKFPNGYVVELIGGNKTTTTSSVSISAGGTSRGAVTFTVLPDNLGLGVSAALTDDAITLTNASRPNVENCALAGLIVTDQPVISKDPAGGAFTAGTNLTLSAKAIGLPNGLTYQWRRGGINIVGANGATYSKAAAESSDAGSYDLVVTNNFGTATSEVAVVTVPPAIPFVWKGNVNGNWDIATTANWTFNGASSTYVAGSMVEFDDTASTGAVTLTTAISPKSITVTNSTKPYTIGGSAIGGAAVLVKGGSNDLSLTGINTFTGDVTLNAGSLTIGGSGQLGSGTYAGLIANDGSLVYQSSADQTLSGVISGTGSLVKNGTGTLTLSVNESLTGGITVNQGTLRVTTGNFNARFTPSLITVNANGTLYGNNYHALGYNTAVVLNGGTYNLSNEDYKVSLSMTDGVVNGPGELRLGYFAVSTVTVSNSVVGSVINAPVSDVSSNNILNISRGAAASDLTINGIIRGEGGLVKNGDGILTLTAINTYTGPTTVNGGTLALSGDIAGKATFNGATLTGSGKIGDDVTVNSGGVVIPTLIDDGLTFDRSLTLAAGSRCELDVNKAPDNTLTADLIWVANTVTYGGTLKVVASGAPFATGDTVRLFDSAIYVGSFSSYDLPALPAGLNWDKSNLIVDGTITVASIVSTPVITPVAGGYVGSVEVTITSDSGSTIHYTLDGSDPVTSGTATTVVSPATGIIIPVNSTVTVNAYASMTGLSKSATATSTFNTAPSAVWTATTGSWNEAGNWLNQIAPYKAGDLATFDAQTLPGNSTVSISGARTVGGLTFGDLGSAFDWTVSNGSSGSLVLNNGSSAPVINVNNRTTTISLALTGTNGFNKTGAGTLKLSTTNTVTGGVTVNNGVLDLIGGGGTGGTIRGTATVNTGGTLSLTTGDATGYNGGATALTTINLVGGTLKVNTTSNQTLGSAVINMTGGAITGITGNPPPSTTGISNLDFFGGASALNTFASATTSTISGGSIRMRQTNGVVFNVADGAAAIDLDISSMLRSVTSFTNDDLIKAGAGTMRISGASIMANSIVVNAGIIDLSSTGSIRFTLGNTTSNKITGPGTVTLDGAFDIVSTAVTNTTGSWTLVDVASKSFGSNFTLGSTWTNTAGVWSKTDGTKAWTFNQSSGVLSLAVSAGYSSWISSFVGLSNTTASGDPDGDGIANLMEYVLNGNPGASNPAVLPALNASGENFVFSFTRRSESANDTTQVFQYGTSLTSWTEVRLTGTLGAEVSFGTPANGIQSVTVTIPKGNNTRLFGRLKVTQP